MDDGLKIITNILGFERVKSDEPLKYHQGQTTETTADYFYIATTQKELVDTLNLCLDLKVNFTVLGAGAKNPITSSKLSGLTIKNRAHAIKLSGIKGKFGTGGLGIESALLEVESGVSVGKLNEYLHQEGLAEVETVDSEVTVGDEIGQNIHLRNMTEAIKIWENGVEEKVSVVDVKDEYLILSVVLRVHSKSR